MKPILFGIVLTAICFGGWPLVARMAGKTGVTGTFIMAALALVPISVGLLYQGVNLPTTFSAWRLAAAGVMMGTGFIAYTFVISNPRVEVSITVPVTSALMIIVTTVGSRWFFSEPLTTQKVLGIVLLIMGIVFLRPEQQKVSEETPVSQTAVIDQ